MRSFFIFVLLLGCFLPLQAAIDFDAIKEDQINVDTLHITKEAFFQFVDLQVQRKKAGLGTYGIVELDPCEFPVQGRRLLELKGLDGKSIRLSSTPSCSEMVIHKLLSQNYQFSPEEPSRYAARRCIYTTLKAFRPMMEYYSLHYEERAIGACTYCEDQEKRRLEKIAYIQQKTEQFCGTNQPRVRQFLQDLSNQMERSYRTKVGMKP